MVILATFDIVGRPCGITYGQIRNDIIVTTPCNGIYHVQNFRVSKSISVTRETFGVCWVNGKLFVGGVDKYYIFDDTLTLIDSRNIERILKKLLHTLRRQ